jgi:DNA-binding response OmpR family regulator
LDGFLTESHIVVIGDDLTSLPLMQQALNSDGYRRVSLTSDRQHAKSFFIGREPDLVLIDLHAPRVEAWELLEYLRHLVPADTFVPFLMLTKESTALEKRQALKAGATDLLTKPIDFEELSLRVGRLLDNRRLTVTLQREREMLASMVSDQTEERAPRADKDQPRARTNDWSGPRTSSLPA